MASSARTAPFRRMSGRPSPRFEPALSWWQPLRSQQPPSWPYCRLGRLCDCGDYFMRTQRQLVLYQSILDVLHEPGCPFCRFLKEYQAARLQNHSKQSIRRCELSYVGTGGSPKRPAAAQVFINWSMSPDFYSKAHCDICKDVVAEEDRRIREFVSCLDRGDVSHWLRSTAVLCIPHGEKTAPSGPACGRRTSRCHHRELSPAVDTRAARVA